MAKKTEYEKQKAVWYAKLKAEGFDDIEQDEDNLKIWTSHFFKRKSNIDLIESKIEYSHMTTSFLHEYTFKTELDKIIWTYHNEAISVRDIAKLLAEAKIANVSHVTIWNTVERLIEEMKKMYLIRHNTTNE